MRLGSIALALCAASCAPVNGATGDLSAGETVSTAPTSTAEPGAASSAPTAEQSTRACNVEPATLDPVAPPLTTVDPTSTLNPAPLGLTGYAFYPLVGAPPAARVGSADGVIALGLSAPSEPVAPGEPIKFVYQVRSLASQTVYFVQPMDGSVEFLRQPLFGLFLRNETTGAVYRWGYRGLRIDAPNATRAEDVVALDPQRRDDRALGEWVPRDVVIPATGEFTAWVGYRFCGDPRAIAEIAPGVSAEQVVRGEFTSNAVRLRVQ